MRLTLTTRGKLFQALKRMKYLTYLNLEWVEITPDGALALADVLSSLELLKILELKKLSLMKEVKNISFVL